MGGRKLCEHGLSDRAPSKKGRLGNCLICERARKRTRPYSTAMAAYKRTSAGKMSNRRAAGMKDPERYEELWLRCGGRCEICGTADFGRQTPHLDHDHSTGLVRGILCARCNTGLGLLGDSETTLQKAQEYLRRTWLESLR